MMFIGLVFLCLMTITYVSMTTTASGLDRGKIQRIRTAESSLRNETQKTSHFDNISNKIQDIMTAESSLRNDTQKTSHFDNISNKIQRIRTAESSLRNETQKTSHFDNISNKIQDITTAESSLRNETKTSSPFDNTSNKEIRHIVYLKVYKAASSTVQNILFRFGLKRNLNFVFPRQGQHLHSKDQLMPIKPPEHYDILATHSIFKEELFTVLPNDSINVAIVREPFARMVSAAFYYRDVFNESYLNRIPKDGFIENLVNQSERYDTDYFSKTKNSMAKDFGFPTGLTIRDTNKINEILDYTDKRFKFIMVAERFDESLVLLKRLLNWKLSDILYSQSNTYSHARHMPLSAEAMEKFRKTCFLDYMIYDRFKSKFDAIVKQQGADFQQEVEQFRAPSRGPK